MNLDTLRQKRMKRMGVKATGYSGQRRIFFILDRGVRKFKQDLGLWMLYVQYARKQKSRKKLEEILTSVLRLHPTKPELWIYAAKYAMDDSNDMTSARAYMQRGLRFNKQSRLMWLEFAKLEMLYIAKIAARQRILGLDGNRKKQQVEDSDDLLALPDITEADIDPSLRDDTIDSIALENLANTPAMSGAIPLAIFDTAMKQFSNSAELATSFYDMFFDFENVPSLPRILRHIVNHLEMEQTSSPWTWACKAKMSLYGNHPSSASFPAALRAFLGMVQHALDGGNTIKAQVATKAIESLVPFAHMADLDPAVDKVLTASLKKYLQILETDTTSAMPGDAVVNFIENFNKTRKLSDAQYLVAFALKYWPTNEALAKLQPTTS
jgi:U3 small nucleolar RNA-associated protein 6